MFEQIICSRTIVTCKCDSQLPLIVIQHRFKVGLSAWGCCFCAPYKRWMLIYTLIREAFQAFCKAFFPPVFTSLAEMSQLPALATWKRSPAETEVEKGILEANCLHLRAIDSLHGGLPVCLPCLACHHSSMTRVIG